MLLHGNVLEEDGFCSVVARSSGHVSNRPNYHRRILAKKLFSTINTTGSCNIMEFSFKHAS